VLISTPLAGAAIDADELRSPKPTVESNKRIGAFMSSPPHRCAARPFQNISNGCEDLDVMPVTYLIVLHWCHRNHVQHVRMTAAALRCYKVLAARDGNASNIVVAGKRGASAIAETSRGDAAAA